MNDTYFLHQTPTSLAKDLIDLTPLEDGDLVLEPFKGEGAFYNSFPTHVRKEWCETTQGRDYTAFEGRPDWVISNPPYRLEVEGKRINSFWLLLDYFSQRATKGIGFLINDRCLSSLTPVRLETLAQRGFSLTKMVVCSVRKWRGRYYYLLFTRTPVDAFQFLRTNY